LLVIPSRLVIPRRLVIATLVIARLVITSLVIPSGARDLGPHVPGDSSLRSE